MKASRFGPTLALTALSMILGLTPVVEADILVLTDGTRVETQGPPKVEGKRTIYTDLEGRLLALRSSEVDPEATEKANRAAPKAMPGAQEVAAVAEKKPVMVLTDADIPEGKSAPEDGEAAPIAVTVYVTDWCGYCRKTERLLNELEVDFETVDVEKVPGARAEKNRVQPGCGVPVVVVAEESVCGYAEDRIRDMVEELKGSAASPADGSTGEAEEAA